jgi:hypothetical protein
MAHVHVSDVTAVKSPLIPASYRVQGNDHVYMLPEEVESPIR